jgi:hypothetical protein
MAGKTKIAGQLRGSHIYSGSGSLWNFDVFLTHDRFGFNGRKDKNSGSFMETPQI